MREDCHFVKELSISHLRGTVLKKLHSLDEFNAESFEQKLYNLAVLYINKYCQMIATEIFRSFLFAFD